MSLSDEKELRLFSLSIRLPQPPMTMHFDAGGPRNRESDLTASQLKKVPSVASRGGFKLPPLFKANPGVQ
jgi:hypothetical protein